MSHKPFLLLEQNYRGQSPSRTLLYLYSPYRWKLLGSAILYVIKAAPAWLMPILTAEVINLVAAQEAVSAQRLTLLGIGVLVLVLQNIPTHVGHVRLLSSATRRLEAELRSALIRRLQQLSMGFLQDTHSGTLQTKMLRDVEAVQGMCNQLFVLILNCTMAIVIAVTVTAQQEPKFLLFYAVAVPLAVALTTPFRRWMKNTNRQFREQMEEMTSRISEMISMMPVTRAHGLEAVQTAEMEGVFAEVRHRGKRLDMLNALFVSVAWMFSQLMQVSCIGVCGYLAWQGSIQPGDIVMYNGFFAMMVHSISHAVDSLPMLTRGMESVQSIGEILESPDLEKNAGKEDVTEVTGHFVFENVTFSYPGAAKPAVDDLSVTVSPGETVAVVGESGSGKTTLMSLIVGFRRPSGGRILLDGKDMNDLDLRQYRRHLAVVPQHTSLFSGSIRDNITYGLKDVADQRLREVLRMARVDEFLSDLPKGIDTRIGEHGGKLSGGQRQRIAIARALIRDPKVIILDEATSALDVVSEKLVQEAIDQLIRGRTTFIVAHRLSTIRNAGKVMVMEDGKLVEVGKHQELVLSNGHFAQLKALQS